MSSFSFQVFVVLISCSALVLSRPDGAPRAACEDMEPLHPGSPQTTPSLYTTKPAKLEILSDGSVEVTIQPVDGADGFKGFLLMAFDDAGSSEKPIGTFEADNGGKSQHLDCSGMPKSALTHTSRDQKKSLTVTWNPPANFEGSVVFKTTYVQSVKKYWVGQKSDAVRVKRAEAAKEETDTTKKPTATTSAPEAETTTKKPSNPASHVDSWTTTARPETKDAASSLGSLAFYSVIVIGFTIALMA